jgi:hypothetical protein
VFSQIWEDGGGTGKYTYDQLKRLIESKDGHGRPGHEPQARWR